MALPIQIDLKDGQVRALKFGSRVIADFEKKAGRSFYALLQEPPGFLHVQGLLWAGLRWQNALFSYDEAGELVDAYLERDGRLLDLWVPITEALFEANVIHRRPQPNGHGGNADAPNGAAAGEMSSPSPSGSGD